MSRSQPENETMTPRAKGGMRATVADQTRPIHEALHKDPLLSRLTSPDIRPSQYHCALGVLHGFYVAIEAERRRLDLWDIFSLHAECTALAADLGTPASQSAALGFSNGAELLGGLYVAHGASFGRSLFRRNLARALPDMPQHFVTQSTDKLVWRQLTEAMEKTGQTSQGARDVQRGAMGAFELVASVSAAEHHSQINV